MGSTAIVVQPGTVAPGQIEFFDTIQPPLPAAPYELKVTQKIVGLKDGSKPAYTAVQPFIVDGPRFQIDPTSIHMVFPPANQAGTFPGVLPNMVFSSFALPWMRAIDPTAKSNTEAPATPWMGILTVYADELPDGGQPQMSVPTTSTAGALVSTADNTTLPPVLPDVAATDTTPAVTIEMNLAYFQAIAPMLTELPMLAHAREVNTDGKVMLGMDEDGCFSVVMSNRVVENDAKNTVFLVSFEGHQDHLPGGPAIPSNYTKIRLAVLGSWSFTALAASGTFLELMQDLCEPGRGGVGLLMMPEAAATASDPNADSAIQCGYTALQNDMRDGEVSTALYRGPFVPAPTAEDFTYGPYRASDQAMHYDPDTGVFNHAYAAAYQIGRLLALSDATFVQDLIAWRRKFLSSATRTANEQAVEQPFLRALDGVKGDARPVPGVGIPALMGTFMATQLHPVRASLPVVSPRGQFPRLAAVPGIVPKDEIEGIASGGEDPIVALRNKIMNGGGQ